jgi:hypothetical protein
MPTDDINPDAITGCGTCFIFFLKYQLGFSIQQIIAASASTLADVYTNLTGKFDGWPTFIDLVDRHYPINSLLFLLPPLDNIFPVTDLTGFTAPRRLSWLFNTFPNSAMVIVSRAVPVGVNVMLSSDDPATISLPASVTLTDTIAVPLTVSEQGKGFIFKIVHLTASYAGRSFTLAIEVVRPEALPTTRLQVAAVTDNDPCAQILIAGSSQDFVVTNPGVLMDQSGLVYAWSVTGATAKSNSSPTLTIESLPPAGSNVSITVRLTNAHGMAAEGTLEFTTVQLRTGLQEQIRYLNCSMRQLRAINTRIPPNVPVELGGDLVRDLEQLVFIEIQSRQIAAAAERVDVSVKATRSDLRLRIAESR